MATILELCPLSLESSPFLSYLFLQRLTMEIPLLLTEKDATNMRAIAEKANRFLAIHVPQGRDTMVAALLVASESLRRAVWLLLQLAGASRSRENKWPALCFYHHFRFGEKTRH
jgi:hypothetical protein